MPNLTFQQFQSEFFRLYQGGAPQQALALLDASQDGYPERKDTLLNWRMCMLALTGQEQAAVQVLHQALDQGYWWPASLLREDPDLASLQANPEFQHLLKLCQVRQEAAQKDAHPELLTFSPPDRKGQPLPALLFFHGRNAKATTFQDYWRGLAERGWLVALAQSSQVASSTGYTWDDWALAKKEAIQHYRSLIEAWAVDPQQVILAGFSQGAGLAIDLTLTQAISGRGFLGVGPYLRNLDELEAALQEKPVSGVRGYLVTGGQDNDQGLFDRLENLLRKAGVTYERELHPDLAHEFPPDFEATLARALPFILRGL